MDTPKSVKAVSVCVGYADILRLTLARNYRHFESITIATSPNDLETIELLKTFPNVTACVTDVFFRNGAVFNKFAGLEEALDTAGRSDWVTILDADIVLPQSFCWWPVSVGNLYTPRRRMLEDVVGLRKIPDDHDWLQLPLHPQQQEFAGYFQLVNASDPVLGDPPWHETDWTTAGGADSFFQAKWPDARKVRPPFEVLHLGPAGVNWAGRVSSLLDGTVPAEARERSEQLRRLLSLRRGKAERDRFNAEKIVRD